jgi:hypothetical protein
MFFDLLLCAAEVAQLLRNNRVFTRASEMSRRRRRVFSTHYFLAGKAKARLGIESSERGRLAWINPVQFQAFPKSSVRKRTVVSMAFLGSIRFDGNRCCSHPSASISTEREKGLGEIQIAEPLPNSKNADRSDRGTTLLDSRQTRQSCVLLRNAPSRHADPVKANVFLFLFPMPCAVVLRPSD